MATRTTRKARAAKPCTCPACTPVEGCAIGYCRNTGDFAYTDARGGVVGYADNYLEAEERQRAIRGEAMEVEPPLSPAVEVTAAFLPEMATVFDPTVIPATGQYICRYIDHDSYAAYWNGRVIGHYTSAAAAQYELNVYAADNEATVIEVTAADVAGLLEDSAAQCQPMAALSHDEYAALKADALARRDTPDHTFDGDDIIVEGVRYPLPTKADPTRHRQTVPIVAQVLDDLAALAHDAIYREPSEATCDANEAAWRLASDYGHQFPADTERAREAARVRLGLPPIIAYEVARERAAADARLDAGQDGAYERYDWLYGLLIKQTGSTYAATQAEYAAAQRLGYTGERMAMYGHDTDDLPA